MENNEVMKIIDIDLEDIHAEMNSLLFRTNYFEAVGKEKKEIFISTLKKYLSSKLEEAGVVLGNETSVLDLVLCIHQRQLNEVKLYNLIHFMLCAISDLQSWCVVWDINSNLGKEEREIVVNNDILDKFQTGYACDVYKSFAILYQFYMDNLCLTDDVKKLELN